MFPHFTMPFFKWFDDSWVATGIRGNTYTFPLIEVIHLLGLTLLLGSVILVDLRLLGFGMKRQSVSQVAQWANPGVKIGFVVAVTTGFFLFVSEALKCYASVPFFWKMGFLLLAFLFYVTVHKKVTLAEVPPGAAVQKLTGILSLFFWFGIGLAGRAIAFY